MEAVIHFQRVSHRYGKTIALNDIQLDIPAGSMVGLIGPDGVGKSTLLGLSAGVTAMQNGQIHVLGGDMSKPSVRRAVCARIAYMPQGLGRNLYPTLSVRENLDFFGMLFGQSREERNARIDELLNATGLSQFCNRPVGKLSGGMKQKLGICAALIHDPDLLILDEPTTGVDPLSRRQFWELIARMRCRRPTMSVVVATAYMEEAQEFDWIAAMHGGRIIAQGTPSELQSNSGQHSLEGAFTSLMPKPVSKLNEIKLLTPRIVSAGKTAIEAEGLTRRFGPFIAVDHVSFSIGKGEIFGFLGSNGSGKTTTMKMLTGLLPASEGKVQLFGRPLDARDMDTRRRVGYMSQTFSLYSELTVRQNLVLHGQLFGIATQDLDMRIHDAMDRYDLTDVADELPDRLPLGVQQRLQLAVAVLHQPDVLILDEPTSGVDPIARDLFWRLLIDLSRNDGVTIFLSTHFMNEAERCDRISFMHDGKVLAIGSPAELKLVHQKDTLQDVFIEVLEEAGAGSHADTQSSIASSSILSKQRSLDLRRMGAYSWREILEIMRDPTRLAFAFIGPILLLLTFGYGISFDVEHLSFAIFDQDQSVQSRQLLESFQGSQYFTEHKAIVASDEMDKRLKDGELRLAVEVPPNFGKDLLRGMKPELGVWLDGAMPFSAETARGYISGLAMSYLNDAALRKNGRDTSAYPFKIEERFRYNQAFRSTNAIVPSVIVLMLVLIPAIMTAIGVVKEKETGSISNFQSTPVRKLEFLIGKQLPYIGIAFVSFLTLVLLSQIAFGVPLKGSFGLLALASLMYVIATTGFGLLVSSFVRSQVAAIFATAIIAIIPAVNFSGLLVPVSSLSGGGRLMGLAFPAAWYQPISIGVFAKGLGFSDLWFNLLILGLFGLVFIGAAAAVLRKQGT